MTNSNNILNIEKFVLVMAFVMIFIISSAPYSFAKVASSDGYDINIVNVSIDKTGSFPSLRGDINVELENVSIHETSVIRLKYSYFADDVLLNTVYMPKTIKDTDTMKIPYSLHNHDFITTTITILPPENSNEPLHEFDTKNFSISINDLKEPIPINIIPEKGKTIFGLSFDRLLHSNHIVQFQLDELNQTCSRVEVYFDGKIIPQNTSQMNIGANYVWNASNIEIHCYGLVEDIPFTIFILPAFASIMTDLDSLIDSIDAKILPREYCDIRQYDCKISSKEPSFPPPNPNDDSESDFGLQSYEIITLILSIISVGLSAMGVILHYRSKSNVKDRSYEQISQGGAPFAS